jgi:hypothetical protein
MHSREHPRAMHLFLIGMFGIGLQMARGLL